MNIEMSLSFIKFISALFLFTVNVISTFITYFVIRNRKKWSPSYTYNYFSFIHCFSLGLFVGLSLLGLYNSSQIKIQHIQQSLSPGNPLKSYPISEVFLCFGLYSIVLVDWIFRNIIGHSDKQYSPSSNSTESTVNSVANLCPNIDEISSGEDVIELLHFSDHSTFNKRRRSKTNHSCTQNNSNDDKLSLWNSLVLSCGMSLHSFLEALGYGMLDTYDQTISMTITMALHQFLCSAALGFRMAQLDGYSKKKIGLVIVILIGYLFLLPLGVYTGSQIHYSLSHSNSTLNTCPKCPDQVIGGQLLMAVLQSFAAASFLYVVLSELGCFDAMVASRCLVQKTQKSRTHQMICFGFTTIGFVLVCCLKFLHHS